MKMCAKILKRKTKDNLFPKLDLISNTGAIGRIMQQKKNFLLHLQLDSVWKEF